MATRNLELKTVTGSYNEMNATVTATADFLETFFQTTKDLRELYETDNLEEFDGDGCIEDGRFYAADEKELSEAIDNELWASEDAAGTAHALRYFFSGLAAMWGVDAPKVDFWTETEDDDEAMTAGGRECAILGRNYYEW